MPIVRAVRCPACDATVSPVTGELRGCGCGRTFIARKADGSLYVAGPEDIELVNVLAPYRVQLELSL